jgi:hypothetical protein
MRRTHGDRHVDELRERRRIQLLHDARAMDFHRPLTDPEPVSDDFVGGTRDYELEHVALSGGRGIEPLTDLFLPPQLSPVGAIPRERPLHPIQQLHAATG